ncbi:MAG: acyl-CoA dehydrogenase family protein [Candidatus Lambdaproteobacteria bacterium]|nr:acyl-CoA dehydrogenase family protein [Candidatus Lambdaproteobacteria bacterium]
MNINDTLELAAFRAEVRRWIAAEVPPALKGLRQGIVQGPELDAATLAPLDAALVRKGWFAASASREWGGGGLGLVERVVFEEEWSLAGLPPRYGIGTDLLGPILERYGTEAQQRRFLAPTVRGEIVWAQGYSEPGSGSDLASLKLRADAVEGGLLLNGQKIWTSGAHKAHWIFLLVRTDPNPRRKQEGISFVLVDLHAPGVLVKPILTLDGFHHFNETFFENVRVPADQIVGEVHQGWQVAKALMGHERFTHPTANPAVVERMIENLKQAAREQPQGGGAVWDDPALRRQVAALEMDGDCMRYTRYRSLTRIGKGEAPGPETMIFKLFGAELDQRIVELHQQVEGCQGLAWGAEPFGAIAGETAVHAAHIRAATIRGGTSEVQRNVVAKRVLGLPEVGVGSD